MRRSFWISVTIIVVLVIGFVSITTANAFSIEKAKDNFRNILHNKPISAMFVADPISKNDSAIRGMPNFTNFLIENGFIQKKKIKKEWGSMSGPQSLIIDKYIPTERLSPFIREGSVRSYNRPLVQIAKYQLKSIDKIERYKYDEDDVFKIYFTYYVEPLFPGLPQYGPFKGMGTAQYQLWKKEEDPEPIAQYLHKFKRDYEFIRAYDEWVGKNLYKLKKAVTNSQFKDTELQKLQAFITDQWKQVIQIPPPKRDWRELVSLKITGKYNDYSSLYLLGVNRRNLASDALASADKFLKKGDLTHAKKYAALGARHYIESNELFTASEQVFAGSVSMAAQTLEALYRSPKEASKYGWFLMCGPKCYEVADYVFLMTDFAVDYGLEEMDEAKKNLIVNAFVKTLLKISGISNWIEKRTTYLINPGPYNPMDRTINSPAFQKAFMKVLAKTGVYANNKLAETGVKVVIQNSLEFVKGSSNLKPTD